MTARSIRPMLATLVAGMMVVGGAPASAGGPVALYYGARCSAKTVCKQNALTDSRSKRVFGVEPGIRCGQPGATLTFSAVHPAKVRRGGRFVLRMSAESTDAAGNVVEGRAKITGTLRKRRRITARWKVEKAVPGCNGVRTGRLTLRYRGSLAGV
jgi:hypothetical protein